MIQRVQTIYLALAFICMTLLLVFPIFSISITSEVVENSTAVFGAYGIMSNEGSEGEFPMYIVFIALSLFSMAGILLFKNRKRQLAVTRFNFILHLLLVFAIYAVYFLGRGSLEEGLREQDAMLSDVSVAFGMDVGFFLLIPAMVFVFLSIRGIKNDIKLTQMTERLR